MGWLKALFGNKDQAGSIAFHFNLNGDAGYFLDTGRHAWQSGDFDTARLMYQKCAYAITSHGTDQEKAALKEEQTRFAQADPLYHQIIQPIKERVIQEPGILQTALYDLLPHDREEIQRALYFAHELGDVRREKKGRSYAIFPAEESRVLKDGQ